MLGVTERQRCGLNNWRPTQCTNNIYGGWGVLYSLSIYTHTLILIRHACRHFGSSRTRVVY